MKGSEGERGKVKQGKRRNEGKKSGVLKGGKRMRGRRGRRAVDGK